MLSHPSPTGGGKVEVRMRRCRSSTSDSVGMSRETRKQQRRRGVKPKLWLAVFSRAAYRMNVDSKKFLTLPHRGIPNDEEEVRMIIDLKPP